MLVNTPFGPIECRYNGAGGFHIGDKVKGYGWPKRLPISERGLFDEEITGTVIFVYSTSVYIKWDKGHGTVESFDYIEKVRRT